MSQVINTNVASLNAQNALNATQNAQKGAMEKLASGKSINRAADDAAGLAIGEAMTAQIKGTNQAIKNTNDGISYVQTAEGALNEISTMLQRARELKVQSLNGTNTADQIDYMDTEFAALVTEMENVIQKTEFNDEAVLNNSGAKTVQAGWEDSDTISLHATGTQGSQTAGTALSGAITVVADTADDVKITVDGGTQVEATVAAGTYADSDAGRAELAAAWESAFNTALSAQTARVSVNIDANDKLIVTSDNIGSGSTIALAAGTNNGLATFFGTPATAVAGSAASSATATDVDSYGQVHAVLYGHTSSTKLTTMDDTTLAEIDDALDVINEMRSGFGALQNRLEHNASNLANVSENMSAARSQIMDADFAAESAELARTNVLQQAGMSMLAQANQAPNNILALVR